MSPQSHYFDIQIQTATPQRLRLLLVEGAIRFARKALETWEAEPADARVEALARCRGILGELLSGVRPAGTPLTKQVTELYVFLLGRVTAADMNGDARQLAEVIGVLEEERETWRQVCESMPDAPISSQAGSSPPAEITAAGMTPILPAPLSCLPGFRMATVSARSQFSVEG